MFERIFKNYDVRGIVDEELLPDTYVRLAYAFASHQGLSSVIVARDGRASSASFAQAAISGFLRAGCSITDIGVASTSQLKWLVAQKNFCGGLMITASHNPPEYNGAKFYLRGGVAFGEVNGLHELKSLLSQNLPEESGTCVSSSFVHEYIAACIRLGSFSPRKVFINPSGGASCEEAKTFVEQSGIPAVLYNASIDGSFSLHSPNPLDASAQEVLKEYCAINGCIGVLLDGDGDRIIFVDEQGIAVPPDLLCALLAQRLSSAVGTVNCTLALRDAVGADNYVQTKVGNVHVQKAVQETKSAIGAEKSGHVFLAQMHGCEAPFGLLTLVLSFIGDSSLHELVSVLRKKYFSSVEHNYRSQDPDADLLRAQTLFDTGSVSELDGVLISGADWWFSVRKSNTEPLIRISYEATTADMFAFLEKQEQIFCTERNLFKV